MVALIRLITSPPNGCCLLSIDATAIGVPVPRSSRVATTVVVPRSKAMAYRTAVVSPASMSIRSSSTITAVTLKSASRSTVASRRSTCRSAVSSRSVIASVSRTRSVRWSARVGSSSSTYRFCRAGRRITWRPTPTVAAFGRVVSGGTSTLRSRVAWTRHASRQPWAIWSGEKVRTSCRVIGTVSPSTRTLHLWQVPWPPHVESMAMPFHDAESKTVTPGGTRTPRRVGAESGPVSTLKEMSTRPVPSWVAWSEPDGSIRPSRPTPASEKSGPSVTLWADHGLSRPRAPVARGARRSSCRPTRRDRAAGRPP